jgi:hypothetical protein
VSAYFARLIAIPAFRDAFNLDPIKRGYYSIQLSIRPASSRSVANSRGRRVEGETPGGRQAEAQVGYRSCAPLGPPPGARNSENWSRRK